MCRYVVRQSFAIYIAYRGILGYIMRVVQADINGLFDKWQLQLRKGVLVYLVLTLLEKEDMYGYALISSLSGKLVAPMPEGTIYPLLNRLVRDELVVFEWQIMDSGPARKYYRITRTGRQMLKRMRKHWNQLNLVFQSEQ